MMTMYVRIITINNKQTTQSTPDTRQPSNNTAHVTDVNNTQPPRHGVIKRTIGGSLARSWPPPLPRAAATAVGAVFCCY